MNTPELIESVDPKTIEKAPQRCGVCDREMTHYNSFLSPNNESSIVCWQCQARDEKGFNARRDFYRMSRTGNIPR